jgi:hypothetical protein
MKLNVLRQIVEKTTSSPLTLGPTGLHNLIADIDLEIQQAREDAVLQERNRAQGFPRYHAESSRLMGEQMAQRWRCERCMSNDHNVEACPVALRARTKSDLDEVVKRYTTYERQTLENGQRIGKLEAALKDLPTAVRADLYEPARELQKRVETLTRAFGERLSKLEGTTSKLEGTTAETRFVVGCVEALEKRIEAKLVELHARLGSVEKDRYEYATLTSRVHDLERYLHAGELPRDAYDRLGGGAGPRQGVTADELMEEMYPGFRPHQHGKVRVSQDGKRVLYIDERRVRNSADANRFRGVSVDRIERFHDPGMPPHVRLYLEEEVLAPIMADKRYTAEEIGRVVFGSRFDAMDRREHPGQRKMREAEEAHNRLSDAHITECLQGHKSVLDALETRLNGLGEKVDLLDKGLGACERHTERVEERLETTNALVSEHSAALGKLEMAARGEVAGYQEQNRRIGKLESGTVSGTAHSELMNRVNVVERSERELHDKLAATGTVFDRRIRTLEEWHKQLSGVAKQPVQAQAPARPTFLMGGQGGQMPPRDPGELLRPVPGLTLDDS